jgi:hypothetical protein
LDGLDNAAGLASAGCPGTLPQNRACHHQNLGAVRRQTRRASHNKKMSSGIPDSLELISFLAANHNRR